MKITIYFLTIIILEFVLLIFPLFLVSDASKPPANILLQESTLPPSPIIPSAAAPLFSLFKQALGAVTEDPKPPEPEPAKESASEVPLYAPTAAPVPVPLFDPKTLEVNGNEPGEDAVNGNEQLVVPNVSFFNPSQFQSNIAALQEARSPSTPFNPSEFTQQPPPDLPAPTPKSDVAQSQETFHHVFTTAPSQEAASTTLSTTTATPPVENTSCQRQSEAHGGPQETLPKEEATAPTEADAFPDQSYGAEQFQSGAEQSQQQFYDPNYNSYYYGGQSQQYYYQYNNYYTPNTAQEQQYPQYAQNQYYGNQNETPAVGAPQFYDPNQYNQVGEPAKVEPIPVEPAPSEPPVAGSALLEPPATPVDQPWSQEQPQQIAFFNPNQLSAEEAGRSNVEDVRDIPFPSPPPPVDFSETQENLENSFDQSRRMTSEFENLNLDSQAESPRPGSSDLPQSNDPPRQVAESPLNVYSIPQNTSIFNPFPTENRPPSSIPPPEPPCANLPPEPPVASTPLSAYFSQRQDSRPSSVASNRSQLASFFDQDVPIFSAAAPAVSSAFSQSAADFFNTPNSNTPQQSAPLARNESAMFSNLQTNAWQSNPQTFSTGQSFSKASSPPPVQLTEPLKELQHEVQPVKPEPALTPPAAQNFGFAPPKKEISPAATPKDYTHPPQPSQIQLSDSYSQDQPITSYFQPQPAAFLAPRQAKGKQVETQPSQASNYFSPAPVQEETRASPGGDGQHSAASPPAVQFFNPVTHFSPQKETSQAASFAQTPFLQTSVAGNQSSLSKFFVNEPQAPASNLFEQQTNAPFPPVGPPAQREIQSLPPQIPVAAPLQTVPVAQPPPPAAAQMPQPTAAINEPPSAASPNEPGVQLFNPTLFGQSQKAFPQADGNKFRIKTALNKYALPPSLSNSIPSYFAPPSSFGLPAQPPSQSHPLTGAVSPAYSPQVQPEIISPPPAPFSPPVTSPEQSVQPPPPQVSSFFQPQQNPIPTYPSQDPTMCKTPPNTPAVIPGMSNPLAHNMRTSNFGDITEEAFSQAMNTSAAKMSPPSHTPSIPVTTYQNQPMHPTDATPFSNSAAQTSQQVASYFYPGQTQNAPLTEGSSSAQPPPPPKNTMSGNSYRLNSRPQYAQAPGLGSSVSAIASLAASMAMSSPIPSSGTQPHDGFAPIPSIAFSTSQADPGLSSTMSLDSNSGFYERVSYHWFFKRVIEKKDIWSPFSSIDSQALEAAFQSGNKEIIVPTDGGRYDVNVHERKRVPIYWDQTPNEVRRCSWFYKNPLDSRSYPYEESFADKLEEEYRSAFLYNKWPRRIELSFGEAIVFSGPNVMSHIPPTAGSILEDWGTIQETGAKSRIVRRGCDEFEIDEGEPGKPDHLFFLVHGIGSVCDLKFRTVVEVVDDFRSMALSLVRSHFRQAKQDGRVNRVEILPVSWHGALHGEETGIDQQLQNITLKSIPKLRHFTNDTLLDILFYTSPVYCQTIIQTVGHEMNRLQQLFMKRNPDFNGGISLGGHSLGSLILFDLLCHQIPLKPEPVLEELDLDETGHNMPPASLLRRGSCKVDYMMGHGTGQPSMHYPQLHFSPIAFFALGSPVGMFVTVRGIESLGQDFKLPTCPAIFNIFHPFDPVAYRIEALVNPELAKLRPVLIPHHKGRKRMHIELRETMARVSTDIKEKLVDSVKSTWNTVYQMAMFSKGENLVQEVDKILFDWQVLAEQMLAADALSEEPEPEPEFYFDSTDPDPAQLGKLNSGRRIDYVLQEAPLESFNEYLFALGSHVCYWESEDTMLMMLRETYSLLGASPDRQREGSAVPEYGRERSWSGGSKESRGSASPSNPSFLTPSTFPPANTPAGPPPTAGFVKK
ncbi:Hypothetical predicted protein [Cloeon dipterum]|uniref:DDHD domain-containing protein n=1 Tax=Cloeon dipterum TaxID=197152 RepID=A0A8S1BY17_9INSE|nr:Hypothetical predicted protein [Cloeon dipterum]